MIPRLIENKVKTDLLEDTKTVLVLGARQVGKTTLVKDIEQGLIEKQKRVLYLNCDIEEQRSVVNTTSLTILSQLIQNVDDLFIDEMHRLSRTVEEVLYSAMEDFALDIIIGKGPSARTVRIDLSPFTLVGATTRAGSLAAPLRDRFGIVSRLEYYRTDELLHIINRSADVLKIAVEQRGAEEIARRSRGTPRIANRLLRRVRDFAQVEGQGVITEQIADLALELLEVDKLGLDRTDRRLLMMIIERFDGGPVGLDTISACISEETETVEDVLEPFLMQLGFIQRTPRGRVVNRSAYEHFGLSRSPRSDAEQPPLFGE